MRLNLATFLNAPARQFSSDHILQWLLQVATVNLFISTADLADTANPFSAVCHSGATRTAYNGIGVESPKIFDSRSPTIHVEALEYALKKQQGSDPTVDRITIMSAWRPPEGLIQSDRFGVLLILANPIPSTSLRTDIKTGNVEPTGIHTPTPPTLHLVPGALQDPNCSGLAIAVYAISCAIFLSNKFSLRGYK